jgi:hypothetical protein
MSKARTLAGTVSDGAVLADGTVDAAEIGSLTLPTGGDIVGTTATQTLTNKTLTTPTIASANLTTALTIAGASGTSGQVLTSAGTGAAPTWASVAAGFTIGTPVNSTSGTAITFTGIPAGVKMIVINLVGVSTNGTSELQIQLGDSGGIETTGYVVRSMSFDTAPLITAGALTSGFCEALGSSSSIRHGMMTLVLQNASTNTWVANGHWESQSNLSSHVSGYKSLSSILTQVSITSTAPNTFDAGAINIAYI